MRFYFPLLVIIPLLLSACSSTGPGSSSGKFYQHDGPPDTNQGDGADAVPRVEPFKEGTLKPYQVLGKTYTPITEDIPFSQTGMGSWYGKQFHGKRTATGETYDMFAMTAAHPTLPLPSYAEVTNLENGRHVIVRVNDRGPFLNSRVIDLSFGAARRLGYHNKGTARVRVRRLTFSEIRNHQYDDLSSPSTQVAQDNSDDVKVTPIPVLPATSVATSQSETYTPSTPRTSSSKDPGLIDNAPPVTQRFSEPLVQTTNDNPPPAPLVAESPSGKWGVQIGFFSSKENATAFLAHAQATLSSMGETLGSRIVPDNNGYRVILGQYASQSIAKTASEALGQNLGIKVFPILK